MERPSGPSAGPRCGTTRPATVSRGCVFVSGTGEAEAAALVENLAVVGELDRAETWPERAVG